MTTPLKPVTRQHLAPTDEIAARIARYRHQRLLKVSPNGTPIPRTEPLSPSCVRVAENDLTGE